MKKQMSKTGNKCTVTFSLPPEAVGESREVFVLGDFNDWNPEKPIALERQKDGSFMKKMDLPLGKNYEFRYLIDQTRWENDWEADDYRPSAMFPHIRNSVIRLGDKRDDFHLLLGMTKEVEKLLEEKGIFSFDQFVNLPTKKLAEMLKTEKSLIPEKEIEEWKKQATLASMGSLKEPELAVK